MATTVKINAKRTANNNKSVNNDGQTNHQSRRIVLAKCPTRPPSSSSTNMNPNLATTTPIIAISFHSLSSSAHL